MIMMIDDHNDDDEGDSDNDKGDGINMSNTSL